ncbi:adenosine deaminase [Rhodovulum visakhapatnamense]|uniref:Adenosine deaminase n=1 Tax=Rhodovulum visakhapatnamense TaxID=364297 RepID=A0A4R8FLE0_9RHOB|nr:adenosine deaminase [Rhodovulum visakhapatnamense]TDX27059.1 adenosine deaminase [Rhodovulum visakhapatnamense]
MTDLPKIELHHHLEGAAPPALIRDLARAHNLDISRIFDAEGTYYYADFLQFLDIYEAACSTLKTPEDYARLTAAVLEEAAAEGVIYLETFLSPDFCGGCDLSAWVEHLEAIREAAERAEGDGILLRATVTCIRHLGPDRAREAARCAAETAGDFVVGFGMAGDESRGRLRDFAYAFDMAREAGLGLTVHAGEWSGPASVREALSDLRVDRIGHGVRAIEDPGLVEHLAETGTVLEVCPGSNVALGLYPSLAAHPIDRLRRAGVKLTVSTDDPPFFHTTMRREYARLAETFGWEDSDFAAMNRVALDAAFCDAETRAKLKTRLEAADV